MRGGGKGKDGRNTIVDDPSAHKEGCRDDVQDSERGELVCGVLRDEATIRTHARFCTVDIVQSVCSLSLEDSLVHQCSTFDEHEVQRGA